MRPFDDRAFARVLAGAPRACLRAARVPTMALALVLATGCGSEDIDLPEGPEPCEAGPGEICTLAGTDYAGFAGDDGPALGAALYLPQDVTIGPDGHAYILDWNNHRIRGIDPSGTIRTVAGTGQLGDGPPGPALESDFNHPTNVVFDPVGRMVVAAWHNSRIKRVDLKQGTLEDICGTGKRAYSGDDGPAVAADLDLPASLAFDPDGNLFVMDQANQVIRKIDGSDTITRAAGQCITNACKDGEVPEPCPGTNKFACGQAENPGACGQPCATGYGGDGGPATEARFAQPFGQAADPAGRIVFDPQGNLYVADTGNHRIRKIDKSGVITTVAGTGEAGYSGDGGPATEAKLNRPIDVDVAADGTIYVADTFNSCVRAIDPNGTIRTAAGVCGERGFSGEGGPAEQARLDRPYGITLGPRGELYIADTYNHRIRLVAAR